MTDFDDDFDACAYEDRRMRHAIARDRATSGRSDAPASPFMPEEVVELLNDSDAEAEAETRAEEAHRAEGEAPDLDPDVAFFCGVRRDPPPHRCAWCNTKLTPVRRDGVRVPGVVYGEMYSLEVPPTLLPDAETAPIEVLREWYRIQRDSLAFGPNDWRCLDRAACVKRGADVEAP